ncbi:hypothetical protein M427DRAFT_58644 [Gonapodya prolifera JEL478]|uniref:Uncharacterized protein n=1 Tax=Gonapodya prolifera (strain JEL478) TaxID=1344416 RepID=A0A139A998_GONPJ|nr:hypothetical protein M427DRAFT_58644 [Gonapodya prolifera JEL478]|eukprot:KXS13401.1 hypothetical protein M427DRAFT_58644 [Gonapodya prolifera JEL478]
MHLPGPTDVNFLVSGGGLADNDELISAWVNIGRTLPARCLWFHIDQQYTAVGRVAWREALGRVRRELVGQKVYFGRDLP